MGSKHGGAEEQEEGVEHVWDRLARGHVGRVGKSWLGHLDSALWLLQVAAHSPSGHSPEQRSFRERQKYFEIEVKQQQVDKPPKRVSLVGEDDLKKMKEEEGMWGSVPRNV